MMFPAVLDETLRTPDIERDWMPQLPASPKDKHYAFIRP
ncbi:MAG: hypothetical protein JWO15_2789 [Sphingomonadales bacterium]|nr:hypothetical protein [Sphingomonadales bacterium]